MPLTVQNGGEKMAELVGYVRKSRSGQGLKINISVDAFENAKRYISKDGKEFVPLVVQCEKVREVLDGRREVTSVCQL